MAQRGRHRATRGVFDFMSVTASTIPILVLTVDDHPFLRSGIAAVLQGQPDMEVVGEAKDGAEAVEAYRKIRPDVTLMDLQMPGMSGLDALNAIRREFPAARIVALTTYEGDIQAVRVLKAGALGYLLKSAMRRELVEAIRTVYLGRKYISPKIAADIAAHIGQEDLSAREIEILQLVAHGEANKTIAWRLSISEATVKAHVKAIFSKLDVADRTHAVTVAAKRGIILL
jgi:DNA-binding NarL/FixJ family response regulator